MGVGVLLALHVVFSLWPALTRIENDFANYWVPAWSVAHGRSVGDGYDPRWFAAEAPRAGLDVPGSFVPQPPANALLLVPLARLPPAVAKAVWSAILAAALVTAWWIVAQRPGFSPVALAALFLLSTSATRNALVYGQPYPLLLLCLCLAWRAWERGAFTAAGLWLAPLLVLKLYGLPFVLALAVARRRGALVGLLGGAALLGLLALAALGGPVHVAWLREVLPASLEGRVQDPYSPIWGSLQSLVLRLFQAEPDLNPHPARDWPRLARALSIAWSVFLGGLAVLAGLWMHTAERTRRAWALLGLVALCASPLTSSYHFVLLLFSAALLADVAVREGRRMRAISIVALTAFVTSGLTHHAAPLAHGSANVLAYPRLWALVALLGLAVEGERRALALAAVMASVVGALACLVPPSRAPGERIAGVSGYLATDPAFCDGVLTWRSLEKPACGEPQTVSSDGALQAAAEWRGEWLGSWDVVVRERHTGAIVRVIGGPAHETAPTFAPDGSLVFASDWRRGLGAPTLYRSR